ncbi:MAG TPA: transcription-repair coupling factor [Anaerolineaceae bacterium]|nr:transcription-repair coupling factor [Anaerolineaceae bacterium]
MLDFIRSLAAYQELMAALKARETLPGLALPRAARLPVTAALYTDLGRPILLLTDRADHALTLLDELAFWAPDSPRLFFPEPNPVFYEQGTWSGTIRRDRMNAIIALAAYHFPRPGGQNGQPEPKPPLIIAPARSLMARTLPRRDMLKATRALKPGMQVSPESLARSWIDIGYEPVNVVLEPGQFSRRGGILDLWPPAETMPARLEFFGDEIDTLRLFDPGSQRTVRTLDRLTVTPAREILPGSASAEQKACMPEEKIDEFYLPLVHPSPASLLDYLPAQALVLFDDLGVLQSTVAGFEEQAVSIRQENIKEGLLPDDFPVPYLSWSELADSLAGHASLELGRSTVEEPSRLAQAFQPGPRFAGRLKNVLDDLEERYTRAERIVLVSRQVSRLKELWEERRLEPGPERIEPEFSEGTLSEGWILTPDEGAPLDLLTDSEIFGWERPQPRQRHRQVAEAPEAAYADLKAGDWVVHVDHGIGRFTGLVTRTLEGVQREFLAVEYDGGDQIFVPIHQADRLTRYVGPDNEEPAPTRLGTQEWSQARQRVQAAVEEVAHDLLDLYARRQVARGFAFGQDTPWQQELEASFPYIETEDQLKAIRAVKSDMEKPRPMDRLLCGDVGYGKTEVALRAAFKAVNGGKQVGVLVPTTVLAQQHYETFCQRLAPFPVTVEMLSRFRSPKEQDEILKRLAAGGIDILIGTHRLIQPDVQFKDLGLAIIDEEQRFGVTHKEFLKRLRTEVDVLTLTATPIPRTLYMALTGVRDISNINTPPEERLPIITHVGPYSPRLARQAILRELERGGQVFFVHNRVQTIPAMLSHVKQLVPEARIGVAHGQMPEHELASVMQHFTRGDIDVLLSTSIIESGLDIPNANTLIVDRADNFGLAQLYQLRGRVGRGAQRAYAYFFRHRRIAPTADGQERLEVIAENTQLGAGYSIAMRDLEMRGAGDLLGMRQSGYIAAVGFHLYTRLLSQSVRSLRGQLGLPAQKEGILADERAIRLPVSVDLPISIGVPIRYIPDQNMRLSIYRRLADLQSEADIGAMEQEFQDRFGPLPEEVANLVFQIRVKLRAEQAGLASVGLEGDQFVLRFPPLPEGVANRNLPSLGPDVRVGRNAYWLAYSSQQEDWRVRLLEALSAIIAIWQPT